MNREKERILAMSYLENYYECPRCKKIVKPRFINYKFGFEYDRSGTYWCPECLKGEGGMFWREIE